MNKYVSIDPGKGDTKVAVYQDGQPVKTYIYNTKYCEGDFCDDALEKGTFIAEINGKTYKVGNGALESAEMEISKKSEIHKISTLLALAMVTDPDIVDELNVVVSCALSEYSIPAKRQEYLSYILPEDETTVKIKRKSDEEPVVKRFIVKKKKVLPETSGIFFLNMIKGYDGEPIGIIDIGNGTAIGAVYSDYAIDHDFDFTKLQGGDILISSLSEKLSSMFSRYNKKYTLNLLLKDPTERKLAGPTNLPEAEKKSNEQRSAQIIHEYIIKYLREIRRSCDTEQWSLDYMPIIFGGGTSFMLQSEIKKVFGDNIRFAPNGVFANCLGALVRFIQLCENRVIDINNTSESHGKKEDKKEE